MQAIRDTSQACTDHAHSVLSDRSRGFTLIELLVVVSIIALLISILLPSLTNAREQAKLIKCLSNQRNLGQAGAVFTQDHNGLFQLSTSEAATNRIDSSRSKYAYDSNKELLAWPVALARGMGIKYRANWDWGIRMNDFTKAYENREHMSTGYPAALCPCDKVRVSTPFYPRNDGNGSGLKGGGNPSHPAATGSGSTAYWGYVSYGINEDVVGSEVEGNPQYPACWKDGRRGELQAGAGYRLQGQLERVYGPSTVLLLGDAGPSTVDEAQQPNASSLYANLFISAKAPGPYLGDFQLRWRQRMAEKRHPGGRIGAVFCDFHAEAVRPVEFYSDASIKKLPIRYAPQVRVSPYPPDRRN